MVIYLKNICIEWKKIAECYSFWCNVWLLNIGLNNGALAQAMELKTKVFLVQKMRHYDITMIKQYLHRT